MKYLNDKSLEEYKTWEEVESILKKALNNPLINLIYDVDENFKRTAIEEYKEEWEQLHKIERKEGKSGIVKAIDKLSNDIDIKEISKPTTKTNNDIQLHDKVIITNGIFKGFIGKSLNVRFDEKKDIAIHKLQMSDGNILTIPETDLKLYEKAKCNLPKIKEELMNNMDKKIFDNIGNVKVIIEPHKTKVQLMNGIFGDTSHGYEDEDYNKEENIRIAYIHAIRHYCKVLLREE